MYGMSMCSVWTDVWTPTVCLSLAYISAGDACQRVNPLPTNDAPMRRDLCELSVSLWEFIWGF